MKRCEGERLKKANRQRDNKVVSIDLQMESGHPRFAVFRNMWMRAKA